MRPVLASPPGPSARVRAFNGCVARGRRSVRSIKPCLRRDPIAHLDGLAPPTSPSRLPPARGLVHAQRARLGLRDGRARSRSSSTTRTARWRRPRLGCARCWSPRSSARPPPRIWTAPASAACCRPLPRRGGGLRGAGAADLRRRGSRARPGLAAVDGTLALVGRALTRAAVAATLKPTGELEAGNTLLNVSFSLCFAIGPALGGLVVVARGVERRAVGERRALRRDEHHPRYEPLRCPPAHADAGDGWLARVRAGISHALGNRRCAASSSPTPSHLSAPR